MTGGHHSSAVRVTVAALLLQGGGEAAVADLGGSIITGVHSNPLAVLARQLDIPLHDINGNVPLYLRDGSELDAQVDKEVRVLKRSSFIFAAQGGWG